MVWVANLYMSLFGRLRLDIKHEHMEIAASKTELAPQEGPSARAKEEIECKFVRWDFADENPLLTVYMVSLTCLQRIFH